MLYIPTIGLEVHAELKTRTKMFCDSLNDSLERRPNVNICPICTGHPGTLPVVNRSAVESIIRVGMAVGGDLPMVSKFDRKNYFYPDIPKAYQISQYDLPLVFGGVLNGVRLTRVHLEEDTARLQHADGDGFGAKLERRVSLVDFNRAGVPLMELVTEPDIKNADEAVAFAKELQLLLRYLGVSDADMEKGQMRVEANVSIRPEVGSKNEDSKLLEKSFAAIGLEGKPVLGTKVEVKNINSFKAVYGAIQYELKRQAEVLEGGGKVIQETRGWDDVNQVTVGQRIKESAHDYRYFPEPDLQPLDLSRLDLKALKISLPELPWEKRARFLKEFGLSATETEALIQDRRAAQFFEEAFSEFKLEHRTPGSREIKLLINYLNTDLRGLLTEKASSWDDSKISPEHFADLIVLISENKITSRSAKDILRRMSESGLDPYAILQTEGLEQVSDAGVLRGMAMGIVAAHPQPVADFKKGKENALQFLVGKAMAELKGKGNPAVLQKVFRELLGQGK